MRDQKANRRRCCLKKHNTTHHVPKRRVWISEQLGVMWNSGRESLLANKPRMFGRTCKPRRRLLRLDTQTPNKCSHATIVLHCFQCPNYSALEKSSSDPDSPRGLNNRNTSTSCQVKRKLYLSPSFHHVYFKWNRA